MKSKFEGVRLSIDGAEVGIVEQVIFRVTDPELLEKLSLQQGCIRLYGEIDLSSVPVPTVGAFE